MPPEATETHGVYATVVTALSDVSSGKEVAPIGSRVYMVYPMKQETIETVSMKLKVVNPVTGQLGYHWVPVYHATTEKYFLKDFSLIP